MTRWSEQLTEALDAYGITFNSLTADEVRRVTIAYCTGDDAAEVAAEIAVERVEAAQPVQPQPVREVIFAVVVAPVTPWSPTTGDGETVNGTWFACLN